MCGTWLLHTHSYVCHVTTHSYVWHMHKHPYVCRNSLILVTCLYYNIRLCVCVRIYTYVSTDLCEHINMCVVTHSYLWHACITTYVCVCVWGYTHKTVHISVSTYICMSQLIHTCATPVFHKCLCVCVRINTINSTYFCEHIDMCVITHSYLRYEFVIYVCVCAWG